MWHFGLRIIEDWRLERGARPIALLRFCVDLGVRIATSKVRHKYQLSKRAMTQLSYNEGAALPSNAPAWAVAASERIQAKLKDGLLSTSPPPPGVKSILLHSCCAPCSGAMVEEMMSYKDVTVAVFFYNPNIHPKV
jgi:hypothetical protein